jgi:hypothetical protein
MPGLAATSSLIRSYEEGNEGRMNAFMSWLSYTLWSLITVWWPLWWRRCWP